MNSNKLSWKILFAIVLCLGTMSQLGAKGKSFDKKVAILGTGYVGLVSGACLANLGHEIVCADINKQKIDALLGGEIPFFEPGLEELVRIGVNKGKLSFTTDVERVIQDSDLIMIAVGTPAAETGDVDLRALDAVVKTISKNLNGYKVICIKSTVPIGTNKRVKRIFKNHVGGNADFDVISNPEFLREGSAINDFCKLNPIVIGSESERAAEVMRGLYSPLIEQGIQLIESNFETAETIKYAWNAYSATKVSYVNQIAELCNTTGADISAVIKGMSFSEKLLPVHALKPGPGLGGSCLPKDTQGIVSRAREFGVDISIVRAVIDANNRQKQKVVNMLYDLLDGQMAGKTIALLGLSFKANTDDIRYSAAAPAIKRILHDGGTVKAYDPKAMGNMRREYPDAIYCESAEEALKGADAVLVLTEWNEFKQIDLKHLGSIVKGRVLVDARNIFDPTELRENGFVFANLARR